MVQKIALILLVGCMVLLYGCTGAPSQSTTAPAGNGGQSGPVVTGVTSTGSAGNGHSGAVAGGAAPAGNGNQTSSATGMVSLNESDINVTVSDTTGNAYTALPVDDGGNS